MRSDMAKLVTEKERSGHRERSRKWGKRLAYDPGSDYEDEAVRGSMSRRASWNKKELSDVLNPLKGYLHKSVGRPWSEVYSEIASNLDRRSVSGIHIFSHLWGYVDLNCWIGVDDNVYTNGKHGPGSVSDFYVHPWTGLLCEVPDRGKRHFRNKKKAPVTQYKLNTGHLVMWMDGIWYNVVHEKRQEWSEYSKKYYTVTTIKKFQLNKKELRVLKLNNNRLELA